MTRIVRLISLVTVLIAVCVLAAVRNSDCGETSAPNPAPTTPPKGEAVKAGVAGTSKPLGVATPSEDLAVREFVDLLKTEAERSEQATTHESDALDHTLTFFKEIVSVVDTLLLAAAGFLVWWQQTTGHTTLTQAKENLSTELQKRAEQRSEERRVGKECRSRWSPYH